MPRAPPSYSERGRGPQGRATRGPSGAGRREYPGRRPMRPGRIKGTLLGNPRAPKRLAEGLEPRAAGQRRLASAARACGRLHLGGVAGPGRGAHRRGGVEFGERPSDADGRARGEAPSSNPAERAAPLMAVNLALARAQRGAPHRVERWNPGRRAVPPKPSGPRRPARALELRPSDGATPCRATGEERLVARTAASLP